MKSSRQLSLLSNEKSMIPVKIEEAHPLVRLAGSLDWEELVELCEEVRLEKVRSNTGPAPRYRALVGALVVRAMKSCDLRSTEDLVRNYLPARYLCDLHNSHWTPDHNTIWEFEQMLGEEGVHQINTRVLHQAAELGFANPKSICSDTTAQEGKIPYPNETGLMGAFAKSVERSLKTLGRKGSRVKRKIIERVKQIKKHVRTYRFFAKSTEKRRELGTRMAGQVGHMQKELLQYLQSLHGLRGYEKVAAKKIRDLIETMQTLLPQIQYWLRTGWVAKDKVVSLFQPDLRAIKRGKVGKDTEFGLKWGINQIKGGYISLFQMEEMKAFDGDYALTGIQHHQQQFGMIPTEFGFDRAAWSESHLDAMSKVGVKRIAVAPKGQARWKVTNNCKKRIIRERAQVEGKIGTIKHYGFNRPEEKTTSGMKRAARRAELRFNLTKLLKDLKNTPKSRIYATA